MIHTTSPVVISILNPIHEQEVHDLWSRRIATAQSQIWKWLTRAYGRDTVTRGYVATHNDTVVGFSLITYAAPEYINEYVGSDCFQIQSHANSDRIGICDAVAVKQEYESQGIATELFNHCFEYLSSNNVTDVIGMSWDRKRQTDGRVLFRKHDFREIYTNPCFYKGTNNPIQCVDCTGECTCGATIFHKQIENFTCSSRQVNISLI